jgi:hypothetical protein
MESAIPSHCSSKERGFMLPRAIALFLFFAALSSLTFRNCTSRAYILILQNILEFNANLSANSQSIKLRFSVKKSESLRFSSNFEMDGPPKLWPCGKTTNYSENCR